MSCSPSRAGGGSGDASSFGCGVPGLAEATSAAMSGRPAVEFVLGGRIVMDFAVPDCDMADMERTWRPRCCDQLTMLTKLRQLLVWTIATRDGKVTGQPRSTDDPEDKTRSQKDQNPRMRQKGCRETVRDRAEHTQVCLRKAAAYVGG